jgi:hypothetical protein
MVVDTGYNEAYQTWFKRSIPPKDRDWNGKPSYAGQPWFSRSCWTVNAKHFQLIRAKLNEIYGYCDVVGSPAQARQNETVTFVLDYIGNLKEKEAGQPLSFAVRDGNREDWNVIFPQDVLEKWFGFTLSSPVLAGSYYTVLSIAQGAAGSDIKRAYRQAARTYHPDYNKDSDANQQFIKVQEAYETLSNPLLRKKYDAALSWKEEAGIKEDKEYGVLWRPPVRCGLMKAKIEHAAGRWIINEVLAWQDQVNVSGYVRVTYWDIHAGGDFGTWAEKWQP